jgi:hypothetical protein
LIPCKRGRYVTKPLPARHTTNTEQKQTSNHDASGIQTHYPMFSICLKPNGHRDFFNIPFYLQSVQAHSANCVKEKVCNRLCGLLVRVPVYRSRVPGSILGTPGFSEK